MNIYSLPTDKIPEELRKLVLSLQQILGKHAYDFLLIGATARDLIIDGHFDLGTGRKTLDIDFAIFVPEWDSYEHIMKTLLSNNEFTRSKNAPFHQLSYLKDIQVDIVPFGNIQNKKGEYTWPPENIISMNVAGFMEINAQCITIETKDSPLSFRVASLPGITIMKIFAWKDRKHKNAKDGYDIGFIIKHYADLKGDLLYEEYDDILMEENFSLQNASARMLGRDMEELIRENPTALNRACTILEEELSDEDNSFLARTLATNGLNYADSYTCLSELLKGIREGKNFDPKKNI